ncbi:MAG: hypothetical protein H7Y42_03765 [Chitinophagaceae bacterium]|nr:hypothetical protein [Chitinophagaceae bacterium]
MKLISIALAVLIVNAAKAQTHDWWAANVGWDGVSHWSRYIITQPAYLGPNALPIPRVGNGRIDSSVSIGVTGNFHFSKGDQTQNLTVYANYCLVKDVISFDLSWIPYERFKMSHAIKERRHIFHHFYYDDHATGDIHLNTNIRLLKKWSKTIDLALRVGYRFPTASGLGTARYTDGPGYYFDISFGKPLGNTMLKWIGMAGFYAWQLIDISHRQNDAFLFGTGLELNGRAMKVQLYTAGYLGYMENGGDKPIVLRTSIEKKLKRTSVLFNLQQGLHDYKFSSVEVGLKYTVR